MSCWPTHKDCLHREYIGKAATLNTKPAKIVKDVCGYAYVAPLDPNFGRVPFSWSAVWNICDNHNGEFHG